MPMVQGSLVPRMRYSVSLLPLRAERIIGTALRADAALQLHHALAQLGL